MGVAEDDGKAGRTLSSLAVPQTPATHSEQLHNEHNTMRPADRWLKRGGAAAWGQHHREKSREGAV